jgi:hypothetical protein
MEFRYRIEMITGKEMYYTGNYPIIVICSMRSLISRNNVR